MASTPNEVGKKKESVYHPKEIYLLMEALPDELADELVVLGVVDAEPELKTKE